jgi:hypothetical protein
LKSNIGVTKFIRFVCKVLFKDYLSADRLRRSITSSYVHRCSSFDGL